MKKRVLVLLLVPVVLIGALLWARTAALSRTERDVKQGLAMRADWSGWPNRGLPLRVSARDPKSGRAKPNFEVILTPQEVRALARTIQLERRPRGASEKGEGKIDSYGITFWRESPNGKKLSPNNGVPNAVRLEWGVAIEGDSEVDRWTQYQLTPDSRRAAQRHLWKTYGPQLRSYVSPPK